VGEKRETLRTQLKKREEREEGMNWRERESDSTSLIGDKVPTLGVVEEQ
jgi:hypothetical protein